MKILIVSETYLPRKDGIATFTGQLAKGLAKKGHQVYVWVPGKKITSYKEDNGNLTVFREKSLEFLFYPGLRVSYWPFQNAEKIIRTIKPDLIHIQNPFLLGVTALFIANKRGIPVVTTSHMMPENLFMNVRLPKKVNKGIEKFFWQYLVWFHNRSDVVTAPTPTALSLLTDRNMDKLSQPITNGVNTKFFTPKKRDKKILQKLHLPSGKVLFVYIGRIDGEKRIDIIVRAFAQTHEKHPNSHLVIAGTGKYVTELQALAWELNLEDSITFTGFVSEADKATLLATSDVFVIASPAELQSIATLEAMSSGLPVLAVDKVALRELCQTGKNGYLFSENNDQELAQKMSLLLKNPDRRKQFGKASRQIVEKSHDLSTSLDTYLGVYEKLQKKKK